jgi:hypothetical protein
VVFAQDRVVPKAAAILIGAAALLLALADAPVAHRYADTDLIAIVLSLVIGATAVITALGPGRLWFALARRWPHIALGLTVSAVTAAIALVAAEYTTRWLYRDITTTSDDRGYFSHRWQRTALSLNTHGFRDREFPEGKPAGVFRVAVLGDSFAYGNGIAAGQRFSDLVRGALPSGVEILNFGVPGHNTPELVSELRSRVVRFAPDFVLVQWFVNDVEGDNRERPRYQPLLPFPAAHEWLHESSAAYTLFDTWWTRRQVAGLSGTSYAGYMRARFGDPQSEAARLDRQALRALVAEAEDRHIQIGFVLFPDIAYELGDAYPFTFLHERMQAFCAERGLTCLDLRPDFAGVRNRPSLWANRLDTHPGALANVIAATRIVQTFEPHWPGQRR